MVEPGSILGEKYRVGKTLGSGGMGIIVEATHVQLGTQVAVKVLRKSVTEKPDAAERFLREARAAAQLRGEHICRVHDYGTLSDGAPFMVMELLQGRDLGTLVDQEGPLPVELVAHCIVQTCEGIAEPHSRGMIHRDLKPANLFLEQQPNGSPSIKILDFGIAKFESSDFKLTETSSVVGSPAYMAPEQLRSSKGIDARTDIWALGVVMFELLTEKQPFTGDTMTDLALAITTDPPHPLPATIDPAFAAIVMKCLQKDPAQRYQNVSELAAALAPFAKLDPNQAAAAARMLGKQKDVSSVLDELLAKQTGLAAMLEPDKSDSGLVVVHKSSKATLLLAGALAVALIVIVVLFVRHGDDAAASKPPALPDATRAVVVTPDAAVKAAAPPDAAEVAPPDAAEVAPPDAAEATPETGSDTGSDAQPKHHGTKHHGGTTPKKDGTTPKKDGTTPKKDGTTPKKDGTGPKKDLGSSRF